MSNEPPDQNDSGGTSKDREDAVAELVESLDSEVLEGLTDVVTNNPGLLRETLADLGYLPSNNEQIITNEKIAELPASQRRIAEAVETMGNPRTAKEIVELIKNEFPEIIEEFQSAKHRPWVSTQLNELVERGLLGRFRDGRSVRYTVDPTEAIRHWALHNNQFVENLDRSDARSIAEDTGMPVRITRKALDEISSENNV